MADSERDLTTTDYGSGRRGARELGRASWRLIREDPALSIFPMAAAAGGLVLGVMAFLLAKGIVGEAHHHVRLTVLLASIIASFPVTFVTLYCEVALAEVVRRKLDGRAYTRGDGWAAAAARVGLVARWTLFTCTIGAVLKVLEEYLPLGGRVVAWIADVSWSLATLFVVPVLAYEGLGPRAALRRSASLFAERWGTTLKGTVAISLVGAGVTVPLVAFLMAGLALHGPAALILIVLGAGGVFVVGATTSAATEVFRICVYRDLLGAAAGPFSATDLERFVEPSDYSDLPDESTLGRWRRQRRERLGT